MLKRSPIGDLFLWQDKKSYFRQKTKNNEKDFTMYFRSSLFLFFSCKKDRTCTCTTTITSSTGVANGIGYVDPGPFSSNEDKTVMTKVTKKTAKANCVSNENTNVYTDITNGDTKTTVTKRDCELK